MGEIEEWENKRKVDNQGEQKIPHIVNRKSQTREKPAEPAKREREN